MNRLRINQKKALILGASGFIGRHLATRLNLEKSFLVYEHKGRNECDLTEIDEVKALMMQVKPDIVFHLAALPDRSQQDVYKNNISITKNILSSLPKGQSISLIHAGSYKQYGSVDTPFEEYMPLNPRTPYGKSKAKSEELLREYGEMHKHVQLVLLRLGPVIGTGQALNTFIPTVIKAIETGAANDLRIADTVWDPTPIDDTVDALIATTFHHLMTNATINISYGVSHSPLAIAKKIANIMGCNIDPVILHDNSTYPCLGKCELAKQFLKWQAHHEIDQTLRRMIVQNNNEKLLFYGAT